MPTISRRALLASGPAAAFAQRRPPNIILVITDDQGYPDLACHGNPYLRTPHLDRLHAESVRFTNFHSDPLCAPTRAGLLTGRYAFRCGVTAAAGGRSLLRETELTLPEILRHNGYRTAIFGKWHLGDNWPLRPMERGFDESLICHGGGVCQAPDYFGNDYFDDTYTHNGEFQAVKGYCTDAFFSHALAWVEAETQRAGSKGSQPFFLYLPTNAPHAPYYVDPKYSQPHRAKGLPETLANFYGMIENFDENLGRLRKRLADLRLDRDTILIYMTDNGTAAGHRGAPANGGHGYSAGMRAQKGSSYEGGHRVPFFVHWPAAGWQGGRDVDELAAHIDVTPTLVDALGLKLPRPSRFDGVSLAPLLGGKRQPLPDRTHFIQHLQIVINGEFQMESPQAWRNAVAMTRRWRLVNGNELYDIAADPAQAANVAGSHPDVVEKLRAAYDRWWNDMSANGFARHVRIGFGSDRETLTRLSCFDWIAPKLPSQQHMIVSRMVANGYWQTRAARAGTYEFTLREQPGYRNFAIAADRARLRIGAREFEAPVKPGATGIPLRVTLPAGDHTVQTWIESATGTRGAYYTDVRRIS